MEVTVSTWRRFSIMKLTHDAAGVYIDDDIMKFLKTINITGKTAIDGGSNIGLFSLVLSVMVGRRGMVHAFELQPTIHVIGVTNSEINKKKNIIHYNNALSDKTGESVGFTYIDYEGENISSVGIRAERKLAGEPHCGSIETIAVDDLELKNVGFIKLDLEGYEPKALDGMWEIIDKWKPYLLIELSPIYLENKQNETIEKIKSHGYMMTELTDCNYVFEPI